MAGPLLLAAAELIRQFPEVCRRLPGWRTLLGSCTGQYAGMTDSMIQSVLPVSYVPYVQGQTSGALHEVAFVTQHLAMPRDSSAVAPHDHRVTPAASPSAVHPAQFADVVVSVARKMDAALWPALFAAVGSPSVSLGTLALSSNIYKINLHRYLYQIQDSNVSKSVFPSEQALFTKICYASSRFAGCRRCWRASRSAAP